MPTLMPILPRADWRKHIPTRGSSAPLITWVNSRPEASFYDLWEETIDPVWLPTLAKAGGATEQQLVFASCAVSRLCLHMIQVGEVRPRIAIEVSEAWTRGEATWEQLRQATDAAYDAHHDIYLNGDPDLSAMFAMYAVSVIDFIDDSVVYHALQAGLESGVLCATLRKYLPFERPPKEKGLTMWQRLAKEEE